MKFTIGIPITKAKFLAETLKSLSEQTFKEFELVIRNNGLTPEIKNEIKATCSEWIGKPNVIYTESKEQLKIADNFNEVVKAANGDYITLLSDDDILHPEFLEEFDNLINRHPNIDVFHCRVKIINQDGELIYYTENCPEVENLPDFLYHRIVGVRQIYLSDFVVSTKALRDIGGFPVKSKGWGVDTLTWHLMGKNGFAFTEKPLMLYRVNNVNFTNSKSNLFIKLEDLVYLKNEKQKIIQSEEFKKESIYPHDFLMGKIEERFKADTEEVMEGISKAFNIFGFTKYFFAYKKRFNFTGKLYFKLILKKLFIRK